MQLASWGRLTSFISLKLVDWLHFPWTQLTGAFGFMKPNIPERLALWSQTFWNICLHEAGLPGSWNRRHFYLRLISQKVCIPPLVKKFAVCHKVCCPSQSLMFLTVCCPSHSFLSNTNIAVHHKVSCPSKSFLSVKQFAEHSHVIPVFVQYQNVVGYRMYHILELYPTMFWHFIKPRFCTVPNLISVL